MKSPKGSAARGTLGDFAAGVDRVAQAIETAMREISNQAGSGKTATGDPAENIATSRGAFMTQAQINLRVAGLDLGDASSTVAADTVGPRVSLVPDDLSYTLVETGDTWGLRIVLPGETPTDLSLQQNGTTFIIEAAETGDHIVQIDVHGKSDPQQIEMRIADGILHLNFRQGRAS